jgi:hypothetical protein
MERLCRPRALGFLLMLLLVAGEVHPQHPQGTPKPQSGDYVARDFHFRSGETLPELRIHYATLGQPTRDAGGRVRIAVLILHGTGGSGSQFLVPQFAGVLFGEGQALDASPYFINLPDNIGHGKSSKPSDGMGAYFPQYEYDFLLLAGGAPCRCRRIFQPATRPTWASRMPANGLRRLSTPTIYCMRSTPRRSYDPSAGAGEYLRARHVGELRR